MTPDRDEFYIGYEPEMPPGICRAVTAAVALFAAAAIGAATLFTAVERPLAPSSFAFGESAEWARYLTFTPAPSLLVPAGDGFERIWLVAPGKHGVEAVLDGAHEGWLRVTGSLITRDPWRMVEVAAVDRDRPPAGAPPAPAREKGHGRRVTLRGEVVDSKCFLGVMNPGERTVHRDCAARCLSGGVTPLFVYTTPEGRTEIAVIVGANGRRPFELVNGRIGHPVELHGTLFTIDDVSVIRLNAREAGA